jgi:hypothetical protein
MPQAVSSSSQKDLMQFCGSHGVIRPGPGRRWPCHFHDIGGTGPAFCSGNGTLDALMRPSSIEVLDRGMQDTIQLLRLQDEKVVETLAAHTSQKPFTDGIRSWSVIRCCEKLDSTCISNPSKGCPKLAIVIP